MFTNTIWKMIKSKWAYNNGKRIMKEALHSIKCEPFGFVNNKYAEAYNNELWVKTYANKKQCLNKIEKLKTIGIECYMSASFPFTIIINES